MDMLIFWIGIVVAVFLLIYLLLGFFYWLLSIKVDPTLSTEDMPALKPVPIPTKKQKSWLHKLVVFVFGVRKWELVENWHYQLKDDVEIVIPKGFRFDGASIPRVFWAMLSPTGLLLVPGLLHDYGYKHQQLWQVGEDGCPLPFQSGADKAFWDTLFQDVGDRVNGIFMVNAIAWMAVNFGGKGSWNKHRSTKVPATRPVLEGCSE